MASSSRRRNIVNRRQNGGLIRGIGLEAEIKITAIEGVADNIVRRGAILCRALLSGMSEPRYY